MITKLQEVLEHLEKARELLDDCDLGHGITREKAQEKIETAIDLIKSNLGDIEKQKMYLSKGGQVWPGVIE